MNSKLKHDQNRQKKYLEFWVARKWFLESYARAEDSGCKQIFKELNKRLKCE